MGLPQRPPPPRPQLLPELAGRRLVVVDHRTLGYIQRADIDLWVPWVLDGTTEEGRRVGDRPWYEPAEAVDVLCVDVAMRALQQRRR